MLALAVAVLWQQIQALPPEQRVLPELAYLENARNLPPWWEQALQDARQVRSPATWYLQREILRLTLLHRPQEAPALYEEWSIVLPEERFWETLSMAFPEKALSPEEHSLVLAIFLAQHRYLDPESWARFLAWSVPRQIPVAFLLQWLRDLPPNISHVQRIRLMATLLAHARRHAPQEAPAVLQEVESRIAALSWRSSQRARGHLALARVLPEKEASAHRRKALQFARKIRLPVLRATVLLELAEISPPKEGLRLVRRALSLLRDGPSFSATADLLGRVLAHLANQEPRAAELLGPALRLRYAYPAHPRLLAAYVLNRDPNASDWRNAWIGLAPLLRDVPSLILPLCRRVAALRDPSLAEPFLQVRLDTTTALYLADCLADWAPDAARRLLKDTIPQLPTHEKRPLLFLLGDMPVLLGLLSRFSDLQPLLPPPYSLRIELLRHPVRARELLAQISDPGDCTGEFASICRRWR